MATFVREPNGLGSSCHDRASGRHRWGSHEVQGAARLYRRLRRRWPFGGVASGRKGQRLNGTTRGGGTYGYGTVFRLSPGQSGRWIETVLHSFCARPHCTDGALPPAGLVLDTVGNLYGTAGGGVQNSGVVFELSPAEDQPNGWNFQVLYDTGSGSSLILDQAGNLYGSLGPGKYGKGAATELSPGSTGWTETYLYSFCPKFGCLDGDDPTSPLTWDASGNLYGATEGGGKGNLGVVFQLEHTATGWKEHVLHNFPAFPTDGDDPDGGLTLDQKGNVYGTTSQGGSRGNGTVFELTRGTDGRWKETILYHFPMPSTTAAGPTAESWLRPAGNLYGTTPDGGRPQLPMRRSLQDESAPTRFHQMDLHRPPPLHRRRRHSIPEAGLTLDSKGNLYGTTVAGGAGGYGVVFEITP